MALYLLFESSSGYALFQREESEEIAEQTPQFQESLQNYGKFSKLLKLVSFNPFSSAENALENINDVSEGVLNDTLKHFLQNALPQVKKGKKSKFSLGVSEDRLGSTIQEELSIQCKKDQMILELLRGIRLHFTKFIDELKDGGLEKAQLGLGHSYSRAKVKFNVHRVDNMIIQSISLLDQLDKDLNTFSMRCREWYSWHFPELPKIISDHKMFAKLAKFIKNKDNLSETQLPELEEIIGDPEKAREVLEAARRSMGTDISEIDMINIEAFADRVLNLSQYREHLHSYLVEKMHLVAPNLTGLVGELVGARLIAHAGSLTNLAKCPASTIQILGAEKALFRALKTRGNTPKYGLIFHSSFIGRASQKNKGRISRYLANKCAIAARLDCFSDFNTNKFGEKLREQVDERLHFYNTGETPKKNVDAMKEVLDEIKKENEGTKKRKKSETEESVEETPKKTKKKKKVEAEEETEKPAKKEKKKKKKGGEEEEAEKPAKKEKKKKEKKKSKEIGRAHV